MRKQRDRAARRFRRNVRSSKEGRAIYSCFRSRRLVGPDQIRAPFSLRGGVIAVAHENMMEVEAGDDALDAASVELADPAPDIFLTRLDHFSGRGAGSGASISACLSS